MHGINEVKLSVLLTLAVHLMLKPSSTMTKTVSTCGRKKHSKTEKQKLHFQKKNLFELNLDDFAALPTPHYN